ncbi:hypothetical protein JOD43_000239 [Pullulanibacillus pueri]|uniref:Uncharacterized protein n=1 Tax=Pullulanibacillus pueri TaxID=1437324 RepID=A0A8J2ZS53_9BACL|nr:hypothetical protein [Pullulanibacillus pueri]MBM7680080.1 hypothetical protein [Pullulanibacillus pueri]GGH74269.1 hypothetical protein GCM10007096_02320 [Pullulanibacillus pueri]
MNHLILHLKKIEQLIQLILVQGYTNKNSLEIMYFSLLREEQKILNRLMKMNLDSLDAKKKLKVLLSILYRDDEAAEPLFRAWLRSSIWSPSSCPTVIERDFRKSMFREIQHELKETVPYVQQIFDQEQSRYIIPALLRTTNQRLSY